MHSAFVLLGSAVSTVSASHISNSQRKNGAPLRARVLAGVLVGVVTTLCGCVLLVTESARAHSSYPSEQVKKKVTAFAFVARITFWLCNRGCTYQLLLPFACSEALAHERVASAGIITIPPFMSPRAQN